MTKKEKQQKIKDKQQKYRTLAKRADSRLLALEKLSKKYPYENVLNWAYKAAMRMIRHWSGEKAKRFNRDIPKNLRELNMRIKEVEKFLNMKSTTKKDIDKLYKKRADTLNKKFGTNFSWEDLGIFFESKLWEHMNEKFGSNTALLAIGIIQDTDNDLKEKLEKGEKKVYHTKNKKVEYAVNTLLSEYGLDITKLV